MAIDFPTSPSLGTQFLGANGSLYIYDNSGTWTTIGNTLAGANPYTNSFRYRTIYTRGYVACGYKDSTPWKNVNRTVHATDITTNLGDQIDRNVGYVEGGWSDYYMYIYGVSDAVWSTSSWVSSFNMQTEVGRTHNSSWDLTTGRVDSSVTMTPNGALAYITGGNSGATDKHNLITETMYAAGTAPANPSCGASICTGFQLGETTAWVLQSGASANMAFATETWTNGGISSSTDGHSKLLGSKHGYGWGKNGSNTATSAVTKWNDKTGASSGVVCYSADNGGEENFEIGQNKGYQLGNYNGAQNNNAYFINYINDALTTGGSDMQPKGHAGMSSAACSSASSQVLGGY